MGSSLIDNVKEFANMGSVAMGSGGGYWFKGGGGVYIGITENCIYCDKCGSFKITERPTFRTVMWIAIAALIATLFWSIAQVNPLFGGIICFVIQLWWMSAAGAFTTGYICRKCGNIHITHGNMMNYPENDRSILDTPYEKSVKIYTEDYDG